MGRVMSNVRWLEDEWQMRCPDCEEWLPLDFEFWRPRQMTRCSACHRIRINARQRASYANKTAGQLNRIAAAKAWKRMARAVGKYQRTDEHRRIDRERHREAYRLDPEKFRARTRAYAARKKAERDALKAAA